jgi:hypothetical protein
MYIVVCIYVLMYAASSTESSVPIYRFPTAPQCPVPLTVSTLKLYMYRLKGAMTRYTYTMVAIAHVEACMSRCAYNIYVRRLCALHNSTRF